MTFPKTSSSTPQKQGWPWASSQPWLAFPSAATVAWQADQPKSPYWFHPPAIEQVQKTKSIAALKPIPKTHKKRSASLRQQRLLRWQRFSRPLTRIADCAGHRQLRLAMSVGVGILVLAIGFLYCDMEEALLIGAVALVLSISTWSALWAVSVCARALSAAFTSSTLPHEERKPATIVGEVVISY